MLNYVLHLLTNLLLLLQTHPAWHNLLLCNTRLLLKRLLYSRKLPFGYNFIVLRYALHPIGYKIKTCIYTKRAREKSTKLTKFASCVLGHPKCFRHPKTTYRYPTLQSRADLMFLHCKYSHFIRKFYTPNNHIHYRNFHS